MRWTAGQGYRIQYVSESGELIDRIIDLLGVRQARDGRVFLRARCRLRGAERTFRLDRVLRVAQVDAADVMAPTTSPSTTCPVNDSAAATWYRDRLDRPVTRAEAYDSTYAYAPQSGSAAPATGAGRKAAAFGIGALIALALFSAVQRSGGLESLMSRTRADRAALEPGSVQAQAPAPPKPAMEQATIGGRTLITYRQNGAERYEVPSLGVATTDKAAAVASIRAPAFVQHTGIRSKELLIRYMTADLDGSGKLSFVELEAFQRDMYLEFQYEENELALRPDEFLARGGGDCEDFALYTAGLLRFWGWDPYLGSIGPVRGTGHAVCLSYEDGAFPGRYTYFTLESWTAADGTSLKPGKYVPVDYQLVGGLTEAVSPGWKLREVYIPEKAWGRRM